MAAALELARELLSIELPRRWQHVQGVARRACLFRRAMDAGSHELLVSSAYVHDIGYAPAVAHTGFHPIDGARHLRRLGFSEDVVGLVAHHSCAAIEADIRCVRHVLDAEFPYDPTLPHDELLFCDLTTTPTGDTTTVEARLAEVKERYAPDSFVHRFIVTAEHELLTAAERAQRRLLLAPALA